LECVWNPRVLVCQAPRSDTKTLGRKGTSLRHVAVVGCLLLKLATIRRQIHANVKLSVGDVNAEVGEGLEVGLILRVGGDLTDDEVGLQTNT
jgi:hypothetical protein